MTGTHFSEPVVRAATVTAATSGIGEGTVRALYAQGDHLVVTGRSGLTWRNAGTDAGTTRPFRRPT
jgi:NADP-dependent 3-hydroxy acid dehydrogenase YdfG